MFNGEWTSGQNQNPFLYSYIFGTACLFLPSMIGGKEAGDRVRTLRDVHISYSIERGLLMQIAWNESCKFSFSSTLGRQGPLGVALSGSICGSLCSSLWLVLCDILSGSFWTALLVLSGSLRGSLTFSCSPWLVLALICFGGPCFAFQPQSCQWRAPLEKSYPTNYFLSQTEVMSPS